MWMFLLLLSLPLSLAFSSSACFDVSVGRTLVGSGLVIMDDVSLAHCQNACLEMDAQRCRSLTYNKKNGKCELHREDKDDHPKGFFPMAGRGDYYHRTCYDKPSVAILRDATLFVDSCYQVTKGKVLIGIVDQLVQDVTSLSQCQSVCQKSEERHDVVCKSAAFYAKEKECIIASQSRHDIPDLFIDDENAVYIENGCLTNGGKEGGVKKIEPSITTETKPSKDKKDKVLNSNNGADASQALETMGHIPITTTTLRTLLTPRRKPIIATPPSKLEQSGYESPSDGIEAEPEVSVQLAPVVVTKAVPTVDPKIVDSYAVEVTPKSAGYNRRLKDARVKTCFTEVRPLLRMSESRVSRAYSLEQCTDICRLCWRCLRGKACKAVAFDESKELCALSLSPLIDGGDERSSIVYHNRGEC